jgi:hypothetical protein
MAETSWAVKLLRNKRKIVVTEKDLFSFAAQKHAFELKRS